MCIQPYPRIVRHATGAGAAEHSANLLHCRLHACQCDTGRPERHPSRHCNTSQRSASRAGTRLSPCCTPSPTLVLVSCAVDSITTLHLRCLGYWRRSLPQVATPVFATPTCRTTLSTPASCTSSRSASSGAATLPKWFLLHSHCPMIVSARDTTTDELQCIIIVACMQAEGQDRSPHCH